MILKNVTFKGPYGGDFPKQTFLTMNEPFGNIRNAVRILSLWGMAEEG